MVEFDSSAKIRVIETFRNVCSDCHIKGEHYQGYVTKRHSSAGTLICADCKESFHDLFTVSLV